MITPAQCRAARALLGITQEQVAKVSGVSLRTISHFEGEQRRPIRANLQAIQDTFERKYGIQFIAENGGGAGIRLLKRSDEGGAGARAGRTI